MSNRIFYVALCVSLTVHLLLILFLSHSKKRQINNPVKKIEINYQEVKKIKMEVDRKEIKNLNLTKEKESPRDLDFLNKKNSLSEGFQKNLQDVSKLSKNFIMDKKQEPKINTLESGRKISVPMLQTEKISNPRYLSYNETIRHKIRQQAYQYVDEPDFKAGQVYLTFVLDSMGTLKAVKIIDEKTQANEYLKKVGLRCIKESAPFPPFPKDLSFPELTFNVIISFEVNEK